MTAARPKYFWPSWVVNLAASSNASDTAGSDAQVLLPDDTACGSGYGWGRAQIVGRVMQVCERSRNLCDQSPHPQSKGDVTCCLHLAHSCRVKRSTQRCKQSHHTR